MIALFAQTHGTRTGTRRGFTLLEAALTTIIIGLGVVSMMELMGACTRGNAAGAQMTTALMLASHVQEMMASAAFKDPNFGSDYFGPEPGENLASFNDIDDFDQQMFNPPLDSSRQPLSQLGQYSQVLTVAPVLDRQLDANSDESAPSIPKTTYTGAARVRVRILYQARSDSPPAEVYRLSWVRFDD